MWTFPPPPQPNSHLTNDHFKMDLHLPTPGFKAFKTLALTVGVLSSGLFSSGWAQIPPQAQPGAVLNHTLQSIQIMRNEPWRIRPFTDADWDAESREPVIEYLHTDLQGRLIPKEPDANGPINPPTSPEEFPGAP